MNDKKLFLRKEFIENEYRVVLNPQDVGKLIKNGFTIFIEKSPNRIYKEEEYEKYGAFITEKKWYSSCFKNFLIIGLKELDCYDFLEGHKHCFFSHFLKNQNNSSFFLKKFKNSNSLLYDFEFFFEKESQKRLLSFGFYAGIIGGFLGLYQLYFKNKYKKDIHNLNYWKNEKDMFQHIESNYFKEFSKFKNIRIGLVGAEGNCGSGVIYTLNQYKLEYIKITKMDISEQKYDLTSFDILYNCIKLDQSYNYVWFSEKTLFNNDIIIVDISCDNKKINNPISIYNSNTTWNCPIYKYKNKVDIIAIDNLPSLLPKDSSDYFSNKCCNLLHDFQNDDNNYWSQCLSYYHNIQI